MSNTWIAFLFCVTTALLAIVYSANVIQFNKSISKKIVKVEKSFLDTDLINKVKVILNNKDSEYKTILSKLKSLETEDLKFELTDISSRINLNFFDFTMFKEPLLQNLLKDNYTWTDLQAFRDQTGFVSDINLYKNYFKNEIKFHELFTIYNLPNINNDSDIMIEKFIKMTTENSSKANYIKELIVSNRMAKILFNDNLYKRIFNSMDESLQDVITIIPNWNVNFVPEILLKVYLSKKYYGENILNFNSKYSSIIDLRKNSEIKIKELESLLNLKKSELGLLTYLGDKTTFWQIKISNNKENIKTTIVLKWKPTTQEYKIIVLKRDLI